MGYYYANAELVFSVPGGDQIVSLDASTGRRRVQRLGPRDVHFLRLVLFVQHDADGRVIERRGVMMTNYHHNLWRPRGIGAASHYIDHQRRSVRQLRLFIYL